MWQVGIHGRGPVWQLGGWGMHGRGQCVADSNVCVTDDH